MCSLHYQRWRKSCDPAEVNRRALSGAPMAWLREHVGFTGDECLLWPFCRSEGYGRTSDGLANRIMCELAHGPAPALKPLTAHSCGRGHDGCVNPRHLRWATYAENEADKKLHGTDNTGERNGQAKLTTAQVAEIRQLVGKLVGYEIAKRFGVSQATVSEIKHNKMWKH